MNKDWARMGQFALVGSIALIVIGFIWPSQFGVLIWTLGKISIAATLGYWIDRSAFPGARPHELTGTEQMQAARYRRAIIMGATIIAVGLAV